MKKKKIKKIILAVIVAIISLISVFSCFKGKYTPEPILTPVSVLKPANSVNDNIFNPNGSYDYLYANNSLSNEYVDSFIANFDFTLTINGEMVGQPADRTLSFYPILYNSNDNFGVFLHKVVYSNGNAPFYTIETLNLNSFSTISRIYESGFGWDNDNGVHMFGGTFVSTNSILFGGNTYPVGDKNNLLTNLVSPVPFLFEGTSDNISWTSSGLDNPNNIQSIYFNTNLSNTAIKNILDTYVGTTAGIDIFNYTNGGVLVRCHIINNSANAFIQIIGGSTTLYEWIYDSIDTEENIYWYGINPSIIDNGNVITSPQGNSLNGFNIYELRTLFSSSNDFVEQPSGDSYEQGYQDGYQAGYSAGETAGYNSGYSTGYDNGYSSGVNNVTTNPNEYNLFTYQEWLAQYNRGLAEGNSQGYEQGYLDGLDDGASSNINYQYVESVLNLIGNFLNLEILPGIKLSYALGVVIILTIISIIKMVVK